MFGELRQQFVEHIYRASACSRPPEDRSLPDLGESLLDHSSIVFREGGDMSESLLVQRSINHGILSTFPLASVAMTAQIAAERAQRLDALSVASDGRSKTSQLRDVFDSVERAIQAGVRYAAIIDDLAQTGLVFTYQTFALTLKRLRRERGIVARASRSTRPESRRALSQTAKAPSTEVDQAPASSPIAETRPAAGATSPSQRVRRPIAPVGARLPDDWLTADLTREQKRLLTPAQRSARAEAVVKELWPNPFDPVPHKKDDPT